MSKQGIQNHSDSQNGALSPEEAIWALFQLLPTNQELLINPNDTITTHESISDCLKRGEQLTTKGVGNEDLKSLFFAAKVMTIDQEGKESLYMKKLCSLLVQFDMVLVTGSIRTNHGYQKTITVESKYKPSRKARSQAGDEPEHSKEWIYEHQCRAAIRKAVKDFNSAKRRANCNNCSRPSNKKRRKQQRLTSSRKTDTSNESDEELVSLDPLHSVEIVSLMGDYTGQTAKNDSAPKKVNCAKTTHDNISIENISPSTNARFASQHHPRSNTPTLLEANIQQIHTLPQPAPLPPQPTAPPPPPPQPTSISWAMNRILAAEAYDFDDDRIDPTSNNIINPTARKIPNFQEKLVMTTLALSWGYADESKTHADRLRILKAARRRIHYTSGLPEPGPTTRRIKKFIKKFQKAEFEGNVALLPTEPKSRAKKSKVQKIIEEHPQLLHKCFRYACNTIGTKASFMRFVEVMNDKLKAMGHNDIFLKKHNFVEWFRSNKGKLKADKFVPRLNDAKKQQRLEWCEWMVNMIDTYGDDLPICWLDEKWFYMTTGRCKTKSVPAADFEDEEEIYIPDAATRSRRFITKVMFMAIVTHPDYRYQLANGKIGLHRVSKKKTLQRKSHNYKFVHCGLLNALIKDGDWRSLYAPEGDADGNSLTVGDFLDMIADYYGMDQDIAEKLCLSYVSKARTNMKKRELCLDQANEALFGDRTIKEENDTVRALTIEDLDLSVMYCQGDEVEEDCSCDSRYMLEKMGEVGQEIRSYFHWVPMERDIILVIDNAGGHGTDDAIQQYTALLKNEYNVVLKHQVPNSPETNLLDLGV